MLHAQLAILAQKLWAWLHGNASRRVLLALVLPFAGMMTAFGIAPDTITDTVPRKTTVEEIVLQAPAPSVDAATENY